MTEVSATTAAQTQRPLPQASDDPLMAAAQRLEGAFLSEMLKSAGFGEARSAFGGGAGEEQFASFLRNLHAKEMAQSGGIGLAEAIYKAMTDGR